MFEELKHCCTHMDRYTVTLDEDFIIEYTPDIRAYNFRIYENGKYIGVNQQLWYCPWCGKKLPATLGDQWEEILEKEYNLKDPVFLEESKIPEEFRTDEWWKKRGL